MTNGTVVQASAGSGLQFVTFRSEDQEFGVDIMSVREIRGWTPTTPLPNMPDFVRGVVNLRGSVLPIVDLKARLGKGRTQATETHVVVVIAAAGRTIGLLVDAVSDILTVNSGDIQGVPDLTRAGDSECVTGIAALEERMVTIIDSEKLVVRIGTEASLEQAA